jgi:8-oxo-dGTP diphosphatase
MERYKRPHKFLFAVDCVIFGYDESELQLLLFKRQIEPSKGMWSLVGGWVDPDESSDCAARNVLYKITGLKDIFQEQVEMFSSPRRDPGGRVISLVYYSLIRKDIQNQELIKDFGAQWHPVNNLPSLIFDHGEMVEKALNKLRLKASHELIGKQLLPNSFTLLELRKLYNAIYQREFDPGNFRKKVLSTKLLNKLDIKNTTESKKGAYYFQFKEDVKDFSTERLVKY